MWAGTVDTVQINHPKAQGHRKGTGAERRCAKVQGRAYMAVDGVPEYVSSSEEEGDDARLTKYKV